MTTLRTIILFFALSTGLWACPFCAPSSSDIYTIASNSLAVAKAKKVGPGKYKIIEAIKGPAKPGKVIFAGAGPNKNKPNGTLVLLSTISNPSQPYWSEPARPLNPNEFFFFKKALQLQSRPRLLNLAAQHLGHQSQYINESAYNILAPEPESEVQKRAKFVGRKRLIQLIQKPTIPGKEKSLYIFMLLPSLDAGDKAWIRPTLFNLSPHADHLPAYMVAYAQVAGAPGIKEMEAKFLPKEAGTSESFGPNSGFTYLGTSAKNPSVKNAARAVVRRELKHPNRGVFTIATLAQWRDFSAAKDIEQVAYANPKTPWVISSATRYFRGFNHPDASAAIKRLRKRFPKIVDSSKHPFPKKK